VAAGEISLETRSPAAPKGWREKRRKGSQKCPGGSKGGRCRVKSRREPHKKLRKRERRTYVSQRGSCQGKPSCVIDMVRKDVNINQSEACPQRKKASEGGLGAIAAAQENRKKAKGTHGDHHLIYRKTLGRKTRPESGRRFPSLTGSREKKGRRTESNP